MHDLCFWAPLLAQRRLADRLTCFSFAVVRPPRCHTGISSRSRTGLLRGYVRDYY